MLRLTVERAVCQQFTSIVWRDVPVFACKHVSIFTGVEWNPTDADTFWTQIHFGLNVQWLDLSVPFQDVTIATKRNDKAPTSVQLNSYHVVAVVQQSFRRSCYSSSAPFPSDADDNVSSIHLHSFTCRPDNIITSPQHYSLPAPAPGSSQCKNDKHSCYQLKPPARTITSYEMCHESFHTYSVISLVVYWGVVVVRWCRSMGACSQRSSVVVAIVVWMCVCVTRFDNGR